MKVEVTLNRSDLIKVVEVDEHEFDEIGDTSTNTEIRKFLLEQLVEEYEQVEINVWIDGGGSILNEKTPDMKVSKKDGSYFIEK
jgi:hypothetical protein